MFDGGNCTTLIKVSGSLYEAWNLWPLKASLQSWCLELWLKPTPSLLGPNVALLMSSKEVRAIPHFYLWFSISNSSSVPVKKGHGAFFSNWLECPEFFPNKHMFVLNLRRGFKSILTSSAEVVGCFFQWSFIWKYWLAKVAISLNGVSDKTVGERNQQQHLITRAITWRSKDAALWKLI